MTIRISLTRQRRFTLRRQHYLVQNRSPGGRTILLGKAATRTRAFKQALMASRPQTSPTAGAGGNYNPNAGEGGGGIPPWQNTTPIINA